MPGSCSLKFSGRPQLFRNSVSISSRFGIEGAVPCRVTEMPAVAQPKRTAPSSGMSSASAAAKPPQKASPAPVVSSTGPALNASTMVEQPSAVRTSAPRAPRVRMTLRAPRCCNAAAARSACSMVSTGRPVRIAASHSFGTTKSARASMLSGSGAAVQVPD